MTVAQIQTRALARLDDAGIYYTPSEVLAKVNEGQRLFVLLTLCLEKTTNLALTANTAFYHLLQQTNLNDFMLPLRLRVAGGARVVSSRLNALDALNIDWQKTAGTPDRYTLLGLDLLGLNKQPSGAGTTLAITYAHAPATLTSSSTPAIPIEYHPELVDYTIHALRVKEGGQDFLDTLPLLQRYLAAAQKMNDYVRARNLAQRYDSLPAELDKVDLSRLLSPKAPNPATRKTLLGKVA